MLGSENIKTKKMTFQFLNSQSLMGKEGHANHQSNF